MFLFWPSLSLSLTCEDNTAVPDVPPCPLPAVWVLVNNEWSAVNQKLTPHQFSIENKNNTKKQATFVWIAVLEPYLSAEEIDGEEPPCFRVIRFLSHLKETGKQKQLTR